MQKLFYCFLFLLSFTRSGIAQVYDRSLGFGFLTRPEVIRYAGNDHWMVVGHGAAEPGQIFTDTIFMLLLDAKGNTLMSTRLDLPISEVHYVYDAVPTPDGGFALVVGSTLCDVVNHITTLYVLNADGSERWKIQSDGLSPQPVPRLIAVTPDGNLLGAVGCYFKKYKLDTGASLWESQAWGNNGCYTTDLVLEAGTENVLLLSGQIVRYLVKSGAPGAPVYNVAQSFNFNIYPDEITPAPDGWYYIVSIYTDDPVERIHLNGDQESVPVPNSNWRAVAAGSDGLYFLGRQGPNTRLLKTDFAFQTLTDQVIDDPYLFGLKLSVHGDTLAMTGIDGCAVAYDPDNPNNSNYPNYKGQSLWFRSFWGAATPGTEQSDATALELELTSPLQVDTLGSPNFPYYKISGGNFRLRVKNSGNVPIKELYVNTIFNTLFNICSEMPAFRKFFDTLNIQPGAEQWLEFGGLTELYQYDLPEEICFWTSSPNGVPDFNHTDDYDCLHAFVAVQNPADGALQFYPNPASDGTLIMASGKASLSGEYRVFDAIGRVMLSGEISKGTERLFLTTDQLPAGFYWLKIGKMTGKLVVAR